MSLLENALTFSKNFHKDHLRDTGEGVFDHCFRVMKILEAEKVTDENMLATALLHHVLKYDGSDTMKHKLSLEFGASVCELLVAFDSLTRKKVKRYSPREFNQAYIVQTFLNLSENLDVLVIRIADKVDNLNNSFVLNTEDRERVALRALNVYAPITRFLGLSGFLTMFEDQSFKILYAADYFRITKYLNSIVEEATALLEDATTFLMNTLKDRGIGASIAYRLKRPYSIYKKEQRYKLLGKSCKSDYSDFPDIVAMRILVNTIEDCYAVDTLVKSVWHSLDEHYEDLIAKPRPSGYRSIHSVFKVSDKFNLEIQIKTFEMHDYNENGAASHIFYKVGSEFKENLKKDPDWLKKLNYWDKNNRFEQQGLEAAKPFSDKIYTFTPLGDIIELVRGATVVDFAYAVHETIGHNFTGAHVNGAIAKASHVLTDGDVVSIKTVKKNKKPSPDWLDFVVTSRARTQIKKELKS